VGKRFIPPFPFTLVLIEILLVERVRTDLNLSPRFEGERDFFQTVTWPNPLKTLVRRLLWEKNPTRSSEYFRSARTILAAIETPPIAF
jgi:hypothetical protein